MWTHKLAGVLLKLSMRLGLFKPYQPIPDLGIHIDPGRERAVRDRWEAIHSELPSAPSSVLDIGCNAGFYVIEIAKLGHFAAGLDLPRFATALALTKYSLGYNNIIPIALHLNPTNVHSLPSFDVIIALQVFHHFCAVYGEKGGVEILHALWKKAGYKLIFETEGGIRTKEQFRSSMPVMDSGPEEWSRKFFKDLGAKTIKTIYKDDNRGRVVLAIEK